MQLPAKFLEAQFTSSMCFEILWKHIHFEIRLEIAFFGFTGIEYFGWGLVLNGYERLVAHSPDRSLREKTRGLLPVVLENQVKYLEEVQAG